MAAQGWGYSVQPATPQRSRADNVSGEQQFRKFAINSLILLTTSRSFTTTRSKSSVKSARRQPNHMNAARRPTRHPRTLSPRDLPTTRQSFGNLAYRVAIVNSHPPIAHSCDGTVYLRALYHCAASTLHTRHMGGSTRRGDRHTLFRHSAVLVNAGRGVKDGRDAMLLIA